MTRIIDNTIAYALTQHARHDIQEFRPTPFFRRNLKGLFCSFLVTMGFWGGVSVWLWRTF